MAQKRKTRKYKKSKRRRQYGGKYQNGGKKYRRTRKKTQKGGCACNKGKKLIGGQKDMGKYYTLRPYNNLANGDVLNSLTDTNTNDNVPIPYQNGGGRGTLPQQLGVIGDALRGIHKLGNFVVDIPNTWRGKSLESELRPAEPTKHPKMSNIDTYRHKVPNYITDYNSSVQDAATVSLTGGSRRRRRKKNNKSQKRKKSNVAKRRRYNPCGNSGKAIRCVRVCQKNRNGGWTDRNEKCTATCCDSLRYGGRKRKSRKKRRTKRRR